MVTRFSTPLLTTVLILVFSLRAISQTTTIPFTPPPPPNVGEPTGRSEGGGTRSPDCDRYETVTPLVPITQVENQLIRWGKTIAAHPTIWLSAPLGLAEGTPIKLTLRDSSGQRLYESTQYANAGAAGGFSITPATTSAPLELGELYGWTISITCDAENPDVPVRVSGYIQRVALPNEVPTDRFEQAALYARSGIWYDALTVLGNQYLHDQNPAIAVAWSSLLQQANLDQLPNTPIESCCRPKP